MKEKKIFRICVICSQGADCYTIGKKGIASIELTQKQINTNVVADFYVCRDKDNGLIAEISANAPIVVEWENK